MRVFLTFLFSGFVGVYCAPGLNMLGFQIPIANNVGSKSDSQGANVALLTPDQTLAVSRHQRKYSDDSDHTEEHTNTSNETYNDNTRSTHLTRDKSRMDKSKDRSETHEQTQDTGLSLDKSGLSMFDDKKQTDDWRTREQESGQNTSLRKDHTANSGHFEESGSRYNKTSDTHDHKEKYDKKKLTLGGGKTFFGKEKGSSATHDEAAHEDGGKWRNEKDYLNTENSRRASSSNQASDYAKDSSKSSANSSAEKETEATEIQNGGNAQNRQFFSFLG